MFYASIEKGGGNVCRGIVQGKMSQGVDRGKFWHPVARPGFLRGPCMVCRLGKDRVSYTEAGRQRLRDVSL